jgi:hypothetical protein
MDFFTLITGVAGLLGLLLQLKDAFPEHREVRKSIVLVVLGIFVGSVIASLLNSQFALAIPLTPFQILVAAFGGVLSLLTIAAAFSPDPHKRSELWGATGAGLFAFLLVLLFGGTFNLREDKPIQLTMDESIEISVLHVRRGNYDRAIHFLDLAKTSISRKDPRYLAIEKQITELKIKQVSK